MRRRSTSSIPFSAGWPACSAGMPFRPTCPGTRAARTRASGRSWTGSGSTGDDGGGAVTCAAGGRGGCY